MFGDIDPVGAFNFSGFVCVHAGFTSTVGGVPPPAATFYSDRLPCLLSSTRPAHLVFAISQAIDLVYSKAFCYIAPIAISKAMAQTQPVTLAPDDVDELDAAILEYFLEGRDDGDPWGKATPSEVYRALDERGELDDLGNPVRQTVQNRIQRLSLAGHLRNKYDTGSYEFVSDPRDSDEE